MQQQEKPVVQRVSELEERMEEVEKGFPNSDYAGHARYHQAIIEEYLEKKKLKSAVIEQLVKGSVWSLLLAAAAAAGTYIKEHVIK
jgi:hypothetical protein